MFGLSIWHWVIVFAVIFLFFGKGKISGLLGELGDGIKSLRKAQADLPKELDHD